MTLEQIAAMVFEDYLDIIFSRLVDVSGLPEGSTSWELDGIGTGFDNWNFHELLDKPALIDCQLDFDAYKEELTEIARILDINTRWAAITDIRMAMTKASLEQPNPEMLRLRIIEENDQTALELLESKEAEIVNEIAFRIKRENAGKKRLLGLACIDLLAAINDDKGLTGEQVGAMLTALEIPNKLLSSGSINTAIGYITAMTLPDNITEGDRAQVLSFLITGLAAIV